MSPFREPAKEEIGEENHVSGSFITDVLVLVGMAIFSTGIVAFSLVASSPLSNALKL